ncbi:hypothetical protein TgHK011_009661 [Trichoderma gracile]|nr:hypothetical protein TgHK011_009661 [Trichoderma gracile]
MSIDLNWETLTTGPDGEALAESIRTFIHSKFQTVQLPRFIRSVNVHGFDFGTIPPELELKDITDPLPDFYEQDNDDSEEDDDEDGDDEDDEGGGGDEKSFADRERDRDRERERERLTAAMMEARRRENGLRELRSEMSMNMGGGGLGMGMGTGMGMGMGTGMGLGLGSHMNASTPNMHAMNMSPGMNLSGHDLGRAFLGTSTPGILGVGGQGRSSYFQAHLATGTQTPLAAVAGAHLGAATGWMGGSAGPGAASASEQAPSYHSREASLSSIDNLQTVLGSGQQQQQQGQSMAKSDVSSTLGPPSRPSTGHGPGSGSAIEDDDDDDADADNERRREPRVEDVQAVFRIRYSGDVRLNLTAEILLDYPMPSFVGIPLKLNITGLTFDGVGVLAHIRKRVHFCFLNPDDALAAVGPEATEEAASTTAGGGGNGGGDLQASSAGKKQPAGRFGGLLQEIKVESEIGERESGRQSLKNVGKVERFVLEQVRRIFEEEFVYPSFWTFLV